MSAAFSMKEVSLSFGGLKAVQKFSLSMPAGALYGLIGPNGAGKTTVFNLITGVYPADEGSMHLGDKSLTGLEPFEIAQAGITRTFQNIRIFSHLTVLQNVLVSFHMQKPYGFMASLFRTASFETGEREIIQKALGLLTLMGLEKRAEHTARHLSYGDQRRLEIARALAANPKVLLLDEPAAGLNSNEKASLMHTIAEIRNRFGVAVLVIEHDMKLIMGISEQILVLDHGETIAQGTPKEVQQNPKVIEAYLGVA